MHTFILYAFWSALVRLSTPQSAHVHPSLLWSVMVRYITLLIKPQNCMSIFQLLHESKVNKVAKHTFSK